MSAEQRYDPRAILAVLVSHGVPCLLIGGTAAFLHGSPLPTFDVDIVPLAEHDALARLSGALLELDARVRTAGTDDGPPFAHDAESLAAAAVWNLTTRHGDLDITFTPSGTRGYPDLMRDAVAMDLGGVVVKVASLADVIRSKEAAGRPKDRRSLPILREILERTTRGRG